MPACLLLVFLLVFLSACGNEPYVIPTPIVAPVPTPVADVHYPAAYLITDRFAPCSPKSSNVSSVSIPTALSSPRPAAVATHPLNKIVFVANTYWNPGIFLKQQDLYVVNPDGSNLARLPETRRFYNNISWSPDAARFAFFSSQSQEKPFVATIMDIDGANVREFTRDGISWSPDGRHLLSSSEDGLAIVNLSGEIVFALSDKALGALPRGAAWSPRGDKIMFTDSSADAHANFTCTANLDGLERTRISGGATTERYWSPDGKMIAYKTMWNPFLNGSPPPGMPYQAVYLTSPDGSNRQRIIPTGDPSVDVSDPAWAPDGQRIAVVVKVGGSESIYVVDITGKRASTRIRYPKEVPVLPDNFGSILSLSWSPDGKRIAFVQVGEKTDSLYVTNVNGTGMKLLTDKFNIHEAAWSPR